MNKRCQILKGGVTVLFVLWQVVSALILLNNLDLVLDFYHSTVQQTERILGK